MKYFMIPDSKGDLVIDCLSEDNILWYMYRAYEQCYFSDVSPGLFEFWETMMDDIRDSGRVSFSFRGFPITKAELTNPYFTEMLLNDFKFQYMNYDKNTEMNSCQNILIQEMI